MPDEPVTPEAEVAAWSPPEGWPEQFKSPEALLKSYQELRPEMDRLKSEREAERAQFAETLAALEQTPPAQQRQQTFDPSVAAWTDAIERGDYAQAMRIQAEASQQSMLDAVGQVLDQRFQQLQPTIEAQSAAQREASLRMAEDLVGREIGADRYMAALPRIQEILAEKPHYLPPAASVEGYRDAILDVVRLAEHASQQERLAAYEAEQREKQAAQTLTSSGRVANVATGDAAAQEFDRIKNAPQGSYAELMNGR